MDLLGRSINHYHITEQMGEGGMAIVYKAFDTHLERDVAVKVIRTDQFAPAILEKILKRFEREAKVVGKLSHPNIVGVIDYGEFEGSPYLVMPYLDGGTLKSYLNQHGKLPWQEAVRLLLPVADALQYAHEHNVLHRDVKPSNILLTDAGQPMLTDFGVAKVLEGDEGNTLTGTGVGLGTPEYMAPEQWQGQFSAQSDIYSLGVVLYEMITGVRPYSAETPAAILIKQITGPLRRPRDFVPDLPDNVERLLFTALAIKPEDRYESMRIFADGLRELEKNHTVEQNRIVTDQNPIPVEASMFDPQKTIMDSFVTSHVPSAISYETIHEPSAVLLSSANVENEKKNPTSIFTKSFWINLTIMISGWVISYIFALLYSLFNFNSGLLIILSALPIGVNMGIGLKRQIKLNWLQMLIIMLIFMIPSFLIFNNYLW